MQAPQTLGPLGFPWREGAAASQLQLWETTHRSLQVQGAWGKGRQLTISWEQAFSIPSSPKLCAQPPRPAPPLILGSMRNRSVAQVASSSVKPQRCKSQASASDAGQLQSYRETLSPCPFVSGYFLTMQGGKRKPRFQGVPLTATFGLPTEDFQGSRKGPWAKSSRTASG